MDDRRRNSAVTGHLSTTPNPSNIRRPTTAPNRAACHYFHVLCLSEKKSLEDKIYTSVNDIKNDAFALYPDGSFNDSNAILTHLDNNEVEVLLTSVPDLSKKGHYKDLFLIFIQPACASCSNPFGIVENQLLLQCPKKKCGMQYCNSCVQAIQDSSIKLPFVCIGCKENVTPKRNMLIEEYIIWKNMCQLYDTQSLLDLKKNSTTMACYSILQNIAFRLTHLQSRLITFQIRLGKKDPDNLFDEQLINDVNDLCIVLRDLTNRIEETNREMKRRGIIISTCLEKYTKGMKHFDRLCNELMKNIEKLETNSKNVVTDTDDTHKEHIKQLYRMDNLEKLSPTQNISAIDAILEDLSFRRSCLSPLLETITMLIKNKPDESILLNDNLKQAKKKLKIISEAAEELNLLRGNVRAIERYTDEYDKFLRDDSLQNISCSKFIVLLETMRIRTEELEISTNFPLTIHLMEKWQNDHGKDDEFKPKVINLFKTVEVDVKHLLSDQICIYSLPYKIGVIGDGSTGKSALVINLAEADKSLSMTAIERSTFGYLQFDTLIYKDARNGRTIPITFVDIEGATDVDQHQESGNYIELINKADCDMYIIVFDKLFSEHNRTCQEHIENILHRKCLLVRSKADVLFNQFFQQITRGKYKKTNNEDYNVNCTLHEIKNHALKTFDLTCLKDEVYLTAAACDDDDLKDAPFGKFDLEKLKKKLLYLATTDYRTQRVSKLAVLALRTVINTCFRRGYTISQTKYRWFAAGASIVPFLDELPAFFGREKIRQAFGIHDSFAVTHAVHGTTDVFEKYLKEKRFTVPRKALKSGYFKYIRPTKTKQTATDSTGKLDTYGQQKPKYIVENKKPISHNTKTWIGHGAQSIAKPTAATLCAAGSLADDATRVVASSTTAALRAASIAGIVVGVVLIPVFAGWSHYSAGKRMNKHLHVLCDDLVVILPYFVVALCDSCSQNIQPPACPALNVDSSSDEASSSDKNSSSSDDD